VRKKIFISYRRQDTAPAAGRVYDRLCQLMSKHNVFFDVSTIASGEDFVTKMTSAIQKCDAVLVFIGKKYLESTADGIVRLNEPDDHVRAEVRVALQKTGQKSDIVLPILVDGALMPRPEALPDDIRALSTRNAMPLRHESFDDNTENIVKALLGVSAKQRIWDDKGSLAVKIGYAVAGVVAALVLLAIGALVHLWLLSRPISASIGDSATTVLLIAGSVLGAWMGFRYEAGRRRRRLQGLI
jgi:TIR domain